MCVCVSFLFYSHLSDVLCAYADAMADAGLPRLRTALLVGGVDMRDQVCVYVCLYVCM